MMRLPPDVNKLFRKVWGKTGKNEQSGRLVENLETGKREYIFGDSEDSRKASTLSPETPDGYRTIADAHSHTTGLHPEPSITDSSKTPLNMHEEGIGYQGVVSRKYIFVFVMDDEKKCELCADWETKVKVFREKYNKEYDKLSSGLDQSNYLKQAGAEIANECGLCFYWGDRKKDAWMYLINK